MWFLSCHLSFSYVIWQLYLRFQSCLCNISVFYVIYVFCWTFDLSVLISMIMWWFQLNGALVQSNNNRVRPHKTGCLRTKLNLPGWGRRPCPSLTGGHDADKCGLLKVWGHDRLVLLIIIVFFFHYHWFFLLSLFLIITSKCHSRLRPKSSKNFVPRGTNA